GERPRLLVVSHAGFSIELVGMGCQVTEKMQRMGPKAGLVLRGCDRAIAQVPCLIESSEQQTSATDCKVSPATMTKDSTRCLFIQDRSASSTRFSAPSTSPICASAQAKEATAHGRSMTTFPLSIQFSTSERALPQSPLERWKMLAAKYAQPIVCVCCVGLASWIASALYFAASANLPSSARLITSQTRPKTDGGTARPRYSWAHSAGRAARFSTPISTTRWYSPR